MTANELQFMLRNLGIHVRDELIVDLITEASPTGEGIVCLHHSTDNALISWYMVGHRPIVHMGSAVVQTFKSLDYMVVPIDISDSLVL